VDAFPSPPLFWTESYWIENRSRDSEILCFSNQERATLYLSQTDNEIEVPGRATFGGWWPADETVARKSDWIRAFRTLFEKFPSRRWSITLPPSYFHPKVFLDQASALRELGASVVEEKNSTVAVKRPNGFSSTEGFSRGNRKRVRAFRDLHGLVRPAKVTELNSAYDLLEASRVRRGTHLSIGRQKFVDLIVSLPSAYRCWLAIADSELMGAALTVDIDSSSLYVLYWGDTLVGRQVSVSASICEYLLILAASEGKDFLDLGISSLGGQVDEGLLRFKQNLGAETHSQFRFYYPPVE